MSRLRLPGMINLLSRLVAVSFLFCLGLPFALFAFFTTGLALGALFLRLLVVYIDLFLAILKTAMSTSSPPTSPHLTPTKPRHRSSYKNASPGTPTFASVQQRLPQIRKTPSYASLVGSGTDRDYEGVGGWRIPCSPDEEAIWMGMNRNLELPASPAAVRKHRRSFTGENLRSGGQDWAMRSPALTRGAGGRTPGNMSPEGYFNI